jgi:hypothetical protein
MLERERASLNKEKEAAILFLLHSIISHEVKDSLFYPLKTTKKNMI